MSDVRDKLSQEVEKALRALLAEAGDASGELPEVALEVPRQKDHGDFACNVAMQLAQRLHRSPREIAADLVRRLGDAGGLVARAEVAGPGFVNVWLAEDRWQDVLRGILEAGTRYGRSDAGKRRARAGGVRLRQSDRPPLHRPRPTGACWATASRACWRPRAGDVTREYYFNDGGRQMRVLGESVKARYLEQLGRAAPPPEAALADAENAWVDEVDGLPVLFPRDGYQGDYIRDIARRSAPPARRRAGRRAGDGRLPRGREGAPSSTRSARRSLALGIHFDVYFNEKALYDGGQLDAVLGRPARRGPDLRSRRSGLVPRHRARPRPRPRRSLRATASRPICCPTSPTTARSSAAASTTIIDVQGADHIEQFPFVRAAMGVLGFDPDRVELVMHQFVTLTSGGEQVKQSTRTGDLPHRRRAPRRGGNGRVPLLHGGAQGRRPPGFRPRPRPGPELDARTRPTTSSTPTRAPTASSARRGRRASRPPAARRLRRRAAWCCPRRSSS